jgi:hypothetical protein
VYKRQVLNESEIELKNGNRNEDPGLLEYKTGKVIFAEDSLLKKMGIKPIDVSDAGLKKNKIKV